MRADAAGTQYYLGGMTAGFSLSANGVEIVIGPGTMGEYTFYYIRDNDGILIELMEKTRG